MAVVASKAEEAAPTAAPANKRTKKRLPPMSACDGGGARIYAQMRISTTLAAEQKTAITQPFPQRRLAAALPRYPAASSRSQCGVPRRSKAASVIALVGQTAAISV